MNVKSNGEPENINSKIELTACIQNNLHSIASRYSKNDFRLNS
jgi:hypothetical protein